MMTLKRIRLRLAAVLALLIVPVAAAQEVGPDDFRITTVGPDGDERFDATSAAVAYNPAANEYFVVYDRDLMGASFPGEDEVYGQRIAADGTLLGDPVRVSEAGTDGDRAIDAFDADVVYNPVENEYLVVWKSDTVFDNRVEIFGQRIAADGTPVGTEDFRLTFVSSATRDALDPKVAYNAAANEYFVVFRADAEDTDQDFEVYGQRFATDGTLIGPARRYSTVVPGNANLSASDPLVAYNTARNEYLVTWAAALDPDDVGRLELFGQRVAADGTPTGADGFRISDAGRDVVAESDLVYNATTDEYLIVWTAPLDGTGEQEILGQRLTSDGLPVGANDFRISSQGPDGNDGYVAIATRPTVAVAAGGAYLVGWQGDAGNFGFDGKEIFVQALGPDGALTGAAWQVSDLGPFEYDRFGSRHAALAFNAVDNEALVVWEGDATTNDEFEIYGQRIEGGAPPPLVLAVTEAIAVADTPALLAAVLLQIQEAIGVSDEAALRPALRLAVQETVGVSDETSLLLPLLLAVAETIGVADDPALLLPLRIAVQEQVAVADRPGVLLPLLLAVEETVGVSDQPGLLPALLLLVAEQVGVTDDPALRLPLVLAIQEAIAVSDDPALVAALRLLVEEQIVVGDAVGVVLGVFGLIDRLGGSVADLIADGTLTRREGQGLLKKVSQIRRKVEREQYDVALNVLGAFVNQVELYRSEGLLTDAQADGLLMQALALETAIRQVMESGEGAQDAPPLTSTRSVPTAFALSPAYPNPFRRTTTLGYALPEAADVRLTVYDALGREVAVLVEEAQNAGFYAVAFHGGHLASGLYLYRLEAGAFAATTTMLLVK